MKRRGKDKHAPIDAEVQAIRIVRRKELRQQTHRPLSRNQTGDATKQRQQNSQSTTGESDDDDFAPNAKRTAISLRRADARAKSKFATFAHAISNTSPTTANSNNETRLIAICASGPRAIHARLSSVVVRLAGRSFPVRFGICLGQSRRIVVNCVCASTNSGRRV